jgi:hypothetical protein
VRIGRAVLVAVAAAVLAWLAVMERDTRIQAAGVAAATAHDPGHAARADSRFRAARFLNPDTTPDLARALLYQAQDQPGRSAEVAETIVRREPDNLSAWAQLLAVSRGRDPAAVERALAAIRRLDPLAFRTR